MRDLERSHKIRVMMSRGIRGKAPKTWAKADWASYHSTFRLTEMTPRALATAVYEGFAFTPVYRGGRRLEDNFGEGWHIALDFDGGDNRSSLDYLMRDGCFCWHNAAFAYSTPSSTTTAPKSRVVFILTEPITSPEDYRRVYAAFAYMAGRDGSKTDPQCKDPLRLYFGSPSCRVIPNWSGMTLAASFALAEWVESERANERPASPPLQQLALSTAPVGEYSPRFLEAILLRLADNVHNAPDGERHAARLKNARAAGGYVAAGYFAQADVERALIAAALGNTDSPEGARQTILDGVEYGLKKPLHPSVPAEPKLSEVLNVR